MVITGEQWAHLVHSTEWWHHANEELQLFNLSGSDDIGAYHELRSRLHDAEQAVLSTAAEIVGVRRYGKN